jgi:hypothetical protein
MFFTVINPDPSPPAQERTSGSVFNEIPAHFSSNVKLFHSDVSGSLRWRSLADSQSSGSKDAAVPVLIWARL